MYIYICSQKDIQCAGYYQSPPMAPLIYIYIYIYIYIIINNKVLRFSIKTSFTHEINGLEEYIYIYIYVIYIYIYLYIYTYYI